MEQLAEARKLLSEIQNELRTQSLAPEQRRFNARLSAKGLLDFKPKLKTYHGNTIGGL